MKSFFGYYTATQGEHAKESTVLIFDKRISIGYRLTDGRNESIPWELKDVSSTYQPSLQQTILKNHRFPQSSLAIDGKEADLFTRELQAESEKPWHKKSSGREWIRNSILVLAIAGILFILYLLIVPWLSSRLASNVSVKTEQQLGDAVYDAMHLSEREDTAASYLLNEFFSTLDVPTGYAIRITVVKENVANAFALPGGRIVVYDALLDEITSYPELAALLSHEFIHVNNKHATRSIFRRLGSKVFLGLVFGRFGTVTSVLVDHADNLKSLTYARSLEKEADIKGLAILTKRKIDPAGFTRLFEHLQDAAPMDNLPEMLASHPAVEKRIRYLEEAAVNAEVLENPRLKAIFEKIKSR